MKKVLIYGILGFAAWQIYKRVKALHDLQINLVDYRFEGNLINPRIILKFSFDNFSDVSANISQITGGVFINGAQKVADVYFYQNVTIQPNHNNFLEIPVTTFLPTVLNSLSVFLSQQLKTISFIGEAVVGNTSFPINLTQTV